MRDAIAPARLGIRLGQCALIAATLFVLAPMTAQASCLNPYSWVAGTTDLCHGAIVYHDYVYDDYGANQGQLAASGGLAPRAGGDNNQSDINSADLVNPQHRRPRRSHA